MRGIFRVITSAVLTLSSVAAISFGAGELMPFPQNKTFSGCLKPSKGQAALNTDVKDFYNNQYKQFVKGPSSGQFYIEQTQSATDDNDIPYTSITTSEAHGYGMIIIALMAGSGGEPNAKAIFDGMLLFARNHPSSLDPNLMNWAPSAVTGSLAPSNCATDGDLDIAYALILADKQWGSGGANPDYIGIAKARLGIIRSRIFDGTTHRITIDDNTGGGSNTRSSDWILDHIHAFASADAANKSTYDAVVTEVFNCISSVANSVTGLVPDFVTGNPAVPDANAGGTEEPNGQYFSYNGCRVPWRIAMDYMHFGTAAAKTEASKLANWAYNTATSHNLVNLNSGYQLNGDPISGVNWGQEREFVAPMAVATTMTGNQAMVDNGWTSILGAKTSGEGSGVYSNAIALACMLAISGNWWCPVNSTPADPNTVLLNIVASGNNGTITNSAGTTTFNKTQNTSVTLTAVPKAGYTFVNWTGDATGTNASITFVMNANKSVTANFASMSPNLVSFISWEANIDNLGSTVAIDTSKLKNGTVSAVATTVKNANYDSYSSLAGYLDTILTGATKISITYTSSKAFWFSLDQTGSDGFGLEIPAATTATTVDISISGATIDVKTPSWSNNKATLNLALVDGFSFDPATDADDAAIAKITGTITISSIKINGYIGNAATHAFAPICFKKQPQGIVGIRAGQMKVDLAKAGNYHISLYAIDGRLVKNITCQLKAGINTIDFKNIVNGEYVIKISGLVSFCTRVLVNR
jgi:uncharacterized repeat protein (TIGR02543 family)